MDISKKAAFVKKMGKKKLKLTKREHFDGGGIAGLLGMGGGAGGTGFNTPSGTTAEQINNAYKNNQVALGQTQDVANVLAPQLNTAIDSQNVIANQYANQANGNGPNVAKNVLNQATGANVDTQAALMSGQRGAGANPALIAREAAQQGAKIQQQAAGQAATMQAQQQIAAEQAGAQLAGNQVAQTQGAINSNVQAHQGEQNILQNANTANNNIQGQLANTTMQGQQGLMGGVLNAAGGISGLFAEGGEVHGPKKLDFIHKMAKMGMEHFHDGGDVAAKPTPSRSFFGGSEESKAATPPPQAPVLSGAQSFQDSFRKSTHGYADGGAIDVPAVNVYQAPQMPFAPVQSMEGGFTPGANSGAEALGNVGKHERKKKEDTSKMGTTSDSTDPNITGANNSLVTSGQATLMAPTLGDMQPASNMSFAAHGGEMHPKFRGPHKSAIANYLFNKGGPVKAMVSPGEVYLNPEQVHQVIHGDEDPVKIGMRFKGKAKVKGDSRKNDFIPADLEEGGVVIDRENMGTAEKRKLFVHRAIAKKKAGSR